VDLENVSNGSAVEALWVLGAPEPKKWLKRPDGGFGKGGVLERVPKRAPKGVVFCRLSQVQRLIRLIIREALQEGRYFSEATY
jgi:hypothetical protein